MPPTTTAACSVPAATAALLAAMQGRAALSGVTVVEGESAELPTGVDLIIVTDAKRIKREWTALGAQRLDESFVLPVIVHAILIGGTTNSAKARLWALAYEVEQAVRGDLTLGGTVRDCKPDGFDDPTTLPTDEGWWASTTVRLFCQRRI